jgi:flagellar basal-body rod protein FlgB
MPMDFFQNPAIEAMSAYMSRLSQRQQIVASNIANIDTPGYKTKDISFHATMEELLSDTSQATEVEGLPMKADKNNVDLDTEMMKISQTSLGYSIISQVLRGKFRTIANSIMEGRG